MMRRNEILIGIAFFLALVLAFPLRDMVWAYIVVPLAYLWWQLIRVYHVFPQQIYWIVLLMLFIYIVAWSFTGWKPGRAAQLYKQKHVRGPIESLSGYIAQGNRGVYFRWRIARSLGLIATGILEMRGVRFGRVKKLEGRGWNPSTDVQEYLDAGLNKGFASFPLGARRTPLDVELEDVISYLEIQLEINRGKRQ
jgi:hypothetical protein